MNIYKYIVLHYLFIQNKKKEIGSLRKNGHLFLSIFRNLDGEFLFFKQKVGSLDYALNPIFKFFVRLHKYFTYFYVESSWHILCFHPVSKNACRFIYNNKTHL